MNIKCTQNIYKSANGVSNVTYYILVPEGVEVRGIVQLSHGMCEYFSRYTAFAKYLCGLGFIVCGNDHIGHGASVSRTADLGFFAARDGWKYLVEDVKHLTDLMQRRYLFDLRIGNVIHWQICQYSQFSFVGFFHSIDGYRDILHLQED